MDVSSNAAGRGPVVPNAQDMFCNLLLDSAEGF